MLELPPWMRPADKRLRDDCASCGTDFSLGSLDLKHTLKLSNRFSMIGDEVFSIL